MAIDNNNPKFRMFKVSLEANVGIPGGVNDEPDYLDNVKRSAMDELHRREIDQRAGMEIMQLIARAQQQQRGHEESLEILAEEIIRETYVNMLHGVELDIKLVRPGEPAEQLEEEDEEEQENVSIERIRDLDIKLEIDKRKLSNNVTQGEAKNTHRLIHSPEVRERLDAINTELFPIYDRILKISEYFDWTIPTQQMVQMIKMHPEGMGGSVSVEWKEPKEKQAEDILKDIEKGTAETEEEIFDDITPVIHSRGIDFPMLIHETVKGIYELISARGIPEDEETAQIVMLNADTLSDEIEDLRYGPFIAADIRDFILENPLSDSYPNVREFVFGHMVSMPALEFLELVKGVLMKTDEARKQIDSIIDEVVEELRQFEMENLGIDYSSEYDYQDDTDEDDEEVSNQVEETGDDIDYSKMSQSELNILLDEAFDRNDLDTARKIGKYLK